MNMKRLSKQEFLEAATKGWEKYEYARYSRFQNNDGKRCCYQPEKVTACCALGAATIGLYGKADWVLSDELINTRLYVFKHNFALQIAIASNTAGSKEAALIAIAALDWPGEINHV